MRDDLAVENAAVSASLLASNAKVGERMLQH